MSEALALALSAGFVVAAIYAFDWVDRQWCRMIDEQLRIEAQPWGDHPALPEEMKARGGNSYEGEGHGTKAARAQTQKGLDRTHSAGATNR